METSFLKRISSMRESSVAETVNSTSLELVNSSPLLMITVPEGGAAASTIMLAEEKFSAIGIVTRIANSKIVVVSNFLFIHYLPLALYEFEERFAFHFENKTGLVLNLIVLIQ